MTTCAASQVLCGPFSENDLPDYQAAKLHAEGHWFECLPRPAFAFLQSIINRTARFGKPRCKASKHYLYSGHAQTDERGYAGQNPIIPMHADSFKKMKRMLKDYGILRSYGRYDDEYEVNYSVTIADLVELPEVRARIRKNHPHGQLSTDEGIYQWATTVVSRYLSRQTLRKSQERNTTTRQHILKPFSSRKLPKSPLPANENQKPSKPQEKTHRPKTGVSMRTGKSSKCSRPRKISNTVTRPRNTLACASLWEYKGKIRGGLLRPHTTTHVSFPISNETGKEMREGEFHDMGRRTAQQIMQDVTTSVNHRREQNAAKRRSRRTLTDRMSLFEQQWAKGQRDKDTSVPASRIVGKDRALVKNQIIRRAEGTTLDTDDFAYWVAHNWQAIGAQYFAKVKSYPERPVVPWLVKCLETYLTAYEQREFLDEAGTRSQTELLRAAQSGKRVTENLDHITDHYQGTVAALKEELRAKSEVIRQLSNGQSIATTEEDEEWLSALSDEQRAALRKRVKVGDYEPRQKPKRRKLR